MSTPDSNRRRWDPWPLSIAAFFTVAIIGCSTFIAFCNRHPADLVAADYYEQEVRYQGQIDSLQRAQARAEQASVAFDAARKRIVVALPPDQFGTNITGTIQLYRPSAVNLDKQFQLAPDAAGVQAIDATTLAPGLWKVRVSWTVDKQDYFLDRKVVVATNPS
jgi:nitrogen fixation protein FixH